MLSNITIYHYLGLGIILFFVGLLGVVISRNVIKILISLEFMLCSININFVAFGLYSQNLKFDGYIFSLFYLALGALELVIALCIFYSMYKSNNSVDIEDYKEL